MALRVSSFFIRFLAIGVLAHAYVGVRLILDAPVSAGVALIATILLILSCVLIPSGMLARSSGRQPMGDRLAWVGLLAMGFFSSLFVLTVLREVVLLVALLLSWTSLPIPLSAVREQSALLVPVLALLGSLIGLFNARRRAPVITVDVPVDDLPAALEGFTIIQISDIHVGPTIKYGYVQAIVDAVNQAGGDMIAITGDVVDGSVAHLAHHTRPLGDLRAPHGVYVVTGNHEYYSGASAWVEEFRRIGLTVLMNQHVVIHPRGEPVVVAGITDYSAGAHDPNQRSNPQQALAEAPADAHIRLLLAHQPRSATVAAPLGFTLQMSGHTHGGQFLPWGLFVRLQQPFTSGLHRFEKMWVYTSRGTGYWGPPMRLGAPSEITRIRLVRAAG